MMARDGLARAGGLVVAGVLLGHVLGRRRGDGRTSIDEDEDVPDAEEVPGRVAPQAASSDRVASARAAQERAEADFRRQFAEAEQLRGELRDLAGRYAQRDIELRCALVTIDDLRAQIRTLDARNSRDVDALTRKLQAIDERRRRENAEHEGRLREHNQQRIAENRRMQQLVDEANYLRLVERSSRVY